MVSPVMVTVFPSPMFLSANVAAADDVERLTVSPDSTPDNAAEPFTRSAVAEVDASYTRLLAVMPVTVMFLAVMFAVVVGCVSE